MLKWIERFGRRKERTSPQRSEADANSYLNNLRENELSLGASTRRGEHLLKAPGQTRAATVTSVHAPTRPGLPPTTVPHPTSAHADDGGDFGTSMAIAMATGNGAIGYAAGGSLAGGFIGAATSNVGDDSANPLTSGG